MKKTITFLALLIIGISKAQIVADFENFSLPTDSFYYNAGGADWQTTNADFQYGWNTSFGGFWSDGFAYTNKKDTSNGGFMNLYNCAAYNGYNLSNYYVTGQPGAFIRLKAPSSAVSGFYVTNTTYAYKSMKNGDAFAKKFGGASGNDRDSLVLSVYGYSGGVPKNDTIHFFLADFRFSNNSLDYILKTWQWVDCSPLGAVDSIGFFMTSSDNGGFGMNTPAFFCIDNFTTLQGVGIKENSPFENISLYPNPAKEALSIKIATTNAIETTIRIYNSIGNLVKYEVITFNPESTTHTMDLDNLTEGLYFAEISSGSKKQTFKLIKH